jgi:hypothetical protein
VNRKYERFGRAARRRSRQAVAAFGVAVVIVLGTATAAHAEGGWQSNMTQVQPTFTSRSWTDNNVDSAHTIITLTNCKGNAGGKKVGSTAITSVQVKLSSGAKIKHACGSYDFGRLNPTTFEFTISAINGQTKAERKIFLNADVKVSF